ncbi:hypothetical protein EPD60_09320 [Flaviaesturariibacter flavus]|uniref:Transglutaminase domain-containing protein n=1 Tax=Flaviaesturariibacter flavus TaxID=2502780 RepID=A0A4R1BB71_9BACT|nr:hypothetical protein [Flaviaesturariibacter flavus]TCJ14197.1 hypothetical protein EPD60_09320 [Flaviaesturariibacter flavus]
MTLFRKLLRISCYTLLLILVVGFFAIPSPPKNIYISYGDKWDAYDGKLFYRLLTVDKIVAYADSIEGGNRQDTLGYVKTLGNIVSQRFYHGYSYYTFRHNWIAYTASKFVWKDLNAIVLPNDILQHSNAACSQVSIVLAACLQKAGISYRKVGFTGHFALEARVNGRWCFLDANLEPKLPEGCHSVTELLANNQMKEAYRGRIKPDQFAWFDSKVELGPVNVNLAPKAAFFHRVTYALSVFIPIALLLFVGFDVLRLLNRRIRRREAALAGKESLAGAADVAAKSKAQPVALTN